MTDDYQRAIAVCDRLWYDYQETQERHGMAAELTCTARDNYIRAQAIELEAYDALKGNS